jgi:hypothetical protein
MKEDALADGINSYGFPLTFYTYFSGKCENCYENYGFKLLYLLTDIGLIAVFVFLVIRLKNKILGVATILLITLAFASCSETQTSSAKDTYKYWAGANPSADIELLKGQYWQSAHWTKEYIMYLKIKPTKVWWDEFLKQNSISEDSGDWTIPFDAPIWFTPSDNSIRYVHVDSFDQGSRCFRDTTTGICYIYEIQL